MLMAFHIEANTWLIHELFIRLTFQIYLHVVIFMCYHDLQTIKMKILHIHHFFF